MSQQYKHKCRYCGNEFSNSRSKQDYCPQSLRLCRMQARGMYAENITTEDQYEKLDGNLRGVLNKLRTAKEERRHLRIGDLVEIWNKQDGRCAITGIAMTCRAERGEFFPYNVSIDRIVPKWEGGTYALDNVQFVCKVANVLKQHYRAADTKDAIREFAEKVIEGQEHEVQVESILDGLQEEVSISSTSIGGLEGAAPASSSTTMRADTSE
jgi:hypothetical protein